MATENSQTVQTDETTGGARTDDARRADPRPENARTDGAPSEAPPDDFVELLRRERADFLNYKRRIELERSEDRARTRGEVVQRLIPLLDELDRALGQRPADLQDNPWAVGVALIHRRLLDTLRELGVERYGTAGDPFDPKAHEALFYQGPPDATERHVDSVVQAGYRMGDRILRPAQVSVVGRGGDVPTPVKAQQDASETPADEHAHHRHHSGGGHRSHEHKPIDERG